MCAHLRDSTRPLQIGRLPRLADCRGGISCSRRAHVSNSTWPPRLHRVSACRTACVEWKMSFFFVLCFSLLSFFFFFLRGEAFHRLFVSFCLSFFAYGRPPRTSRKAASRLQACVPHKREWRESGNGEDSEKRRETEKRDSRVEESQHKEKKKSTPKPISTHNRKKQPIRSKPLQGEELRVLSQNALDHLKRQFVRETGALKNWQKWNSSLCKLFYESSR